MIGRYDSVLNTIFGSRSRVKCSEQAPVKVLLHIGMPKCGSSALQSYLSSADIEHVTKGRCIYVALNDDGRLLSGMPLIRRAQTVPHGYVSSVRADVINAFSAQQKTKIRESLIRLGKDREWIILSCEAWGPNPQQFFEDSVFADPNLEVHLLAYVRPQIEWMNSAWWQWGAWTSLNPRRWIMRERKKALWHTLLQAWADKPWVKSLSVRLLDGDIIQDCMSHLGYQVSDQALINRSLPEIVLRLFQRHRHLRPDPHASAIDFALNRHLHLNTKDTPWIIGPIIAKELVDFFREDNEQLALLLSPQQRERMISDPRWWQSERRRKGILDDAFVKSLNVDDLERLAVAAVKAIESLDAEVRLLRSRSFLQEFDSES